jgi:hypothetical protein
MAPLQREAFPTVDQAKTAFRDGNLAERLADLATVQNEIAWEEALLKEAIKKERKEERFVEPTAREVRERQEAEKNWPIRPPESERTKASARYHFRDAERQINGHRTYEPPTELRGMSAILMKAYRNSKEGFERTDLDAYNKLTTFEETLDRMGIGFARATREEAERSQRQAKFANAIGNYSPRFQEGEIVAVRAWSELRRSEGQIVPPGQRVYKIDQDAARKFVETLGVEKSLRGIDPTKKVMEVKVQGRAERESQKWRDIRFENATKGRGGARTMGDKGVLASVGLGKTTGRIIGKTFDTVADMFESILAPAMTEERVIDGERSTQRREAADSAAHLQREQEDWAAQQQSRREIQRER